MPLISFVKVDLRFVVRFIDIQLFAQNFYLLFNPLESFLAGLLVLFILMRGEVPLASTFLPNICFCPSKTTLSSNLSCCLTRPHSRQETKP